MGSLGKRVREACEDGLKPVIRKTASTVEKAVRSAGHGFERVAKNAEENEKEVSGNLRKYFVDDEGKAHRLDNGKLEKLNAEDKKALGDLIDDEGHVKGPSSKQMRKDYSAKTLSKKEAERFPMDNPNEAKVVSKKITEPTALSRAAEEARVANKDYGGRNYASLKYRGEDGKDVVLVGRSSGERTHSERSIGMPFLPDRVDRISELYTERAPCQRGVNCERWLGRYFQHVPVSHGVEYDHHIKNLEIRNLPHDAYQDQLLRNHLAGDVSGTMGSADFDALVAPRQQAISQAAKAAQGGDSGVI